MFKVSLPSKLYVRVSNDQSHQQICTCIINHISKYVFIDETFLQVNVQNIVLREQLCKSIIIHTVNPVRHFTDQMRHICVSVSSHMYDFLALSISQILFKDTQLFKISTIYRKQFIIFLIFMFSLDQECYDIVKAKEKTTTISATNGYVLLCS